MEGELGLLSVEQQCAVSMVENLSSSLEEQLALLLAACVQRDVVDPVKLLRGEETRTTLMIRRLPRTVSETDLYALLGLSIDCVYLPLFRGRVSSAHQAHGFSPSPLKNRGFGFVNFVSPAAAAVFVQSLSLYGDVFAKSEIVFAHVQGKDNMLHSGLVLQTETSINNQQYITNNHIQQSPLSVVHPTASSVSSPSSQR